MKRPSADDLAEIARGKGSKRDRAEAAAFGTSARQTKRRVARKRGRQSNR